MFGSITRYVSEVRGDDSSHSTVGGEHSFDELIFARDLDQVRKKNIR